MRGIIGTYQKCPVCREGYASSKGSQPIICCHTQPTKFYIRIPFDGTTHKILYDRSGQTIHHFEHAAAVLGEVRSAIVNKTFSPSTYKKRSKTTFSAFWERFQNRYEGASLDKLKSIGRHHTDGLSDLQMRDIATWTIDEWWTGLQKKGLSGAYINDILGWVKAFFQYAVDLDVIERMPKRWPDPLKLPGPEVDEWFSREEQEKVLAHISECDRPIFEFLFITGVRVNEACALRRKDINRKDGVVHIRSTVKRDGSIGVVKNKRSRRIPLVAVHQCLESKTIDIKGFVFTNRWGRRYTDDYLRERFYEACDKAGLKRIKLKNATRHSFGMGLVKRGYDAWQISKIMNHSDIKITEHYIKMLDEDIAGAYGGESERREKIK